MNNNKQETILWPICFNLTKNNIKENNEYSSFIFALYNPYTKKIMYSTEIEKNDTLFYLFTQDRI